VLSSALARVSPSLLRAPLAHRVTHLAASPALDAPHKTDTHSLTSKITAARSADHLPSMRVDDAAATSSCAPSHSSTLRVLHVWTQPPPFVLLPVSPNPAVSASASPSPTHPLPSSPSRSPFVPSRLHSLVAAADGRLAMTNGDHPNSPPHVSPSPALSLHMHMFATQPTNAAVAIPYSPPPSLPPSFPPSSS